MINRGSFEKKISNEFYFMRLKDFKTGKFLIDKDGNFCCFPMEWGDGWLVRFYDMCIEINKELKKYSIDDFQWLQLKEKFGSARCYYGGVPKNSNIENIIDDFEKSTEYICEICGGKGEVRNDMGWLRCLCDKHYEETKLK